jgi:hypothetical protein
VGTGSREENAVKKSNASKGFAMGDQDLATTPTELAYGCRILYSEKRGQADQARNLH